MQFHGQSLVAGHRRPGALPHFHGISPLDGTSLAGEFVTATETEIGEALSAAEAASFAFAASTGEQRALFLENIAEKLVALGSDLLERAHLETGLTLARLESERARTVSHLQMFAKIARENTWMDARIEMADPTRQPHPKPDLRRVMRPIGPVVVFGSSNFPLAYSVVGGDTASALATGNPVIVKAHEAHPGTSELVAEAVNKAACEAGLPAGVFSMLQGNGRTLGPWLANHPATKAITFTGSLGAGRALFDAAASRPDPIPMFAEMSSLNPVVVLPQRMQTHGTEIARALATSATSEAGQFCTKPGLFIVMDGEGLDAFRSTLVEAFSAVPPTTMLHEGIAASYRQSLEELGKDANLRIVGQSRLQPDRAATQAGALLLEIPGASFQKNPRLTHEVFGPFSILVVASSLDEIPALLRSLGGQLTASIFGSDAELAAMTELLAVLPTLAGRVIVNGVPTGVEVNTASQHGGPWPAASDSRFTSVGTTALERFVRPVAFQNCPDALLPSPLQDANPLGIVRLVNGEATSSPIERAS